MYAKTFICQIWPIPVACFKSGLIGISLQNLNRMNKKQLFKLSLIMLTISSVICAVCVTSYLIIDGPGPGRIFCVILSTVLSIVGILVWLLIMAYALFKNDV